MYRIIALCYVEASPTVEKAVSCYKAHRLVALLLSLRSVQSSLAVCKFRAAGKERCKQGHNVIAFLRSGSASKQVLLALGVNRAARDAVKYSPGFRPSLTSIALRNVMRV